MVQCPRCRRLLQASAVRKASNCRTDLDTAASGCTVIVTVLPWESNTHLVSAGMTCLELDVTKEESVQALARTVQKATGGRLHVLVNNA